MTLLLRRKKMVGSKTHGGYNQINPLERTTYSQYTRTRHVQANVNIIEIYHYGKEAMFLSVCVYFIAQVAPSQNHVLAQFPRFPPMHAQILTNHGGNPINRKGLLDHEQVDMVHKDTDPLLPMHKPMFMKLVRARMHHFALLTIKRTV
jgi:hypothetical protein